jgi:hypothetical protein
VRVAYEPRAAANQAPFVVYISRRLSRLEEDFSYLPSFSVLRMWRGLGFLCMNKAYRIRIFLTVSILKSEQMEQRPRE